MKKRMLTILMAFVVTLTFMPILSGTDEVYAADNPYPGNMDSNCTYAAWQKTKDILGIELPKWGNAWQWYSSAQSAGYSVGTTPRANSIVVFKQASWNTDFGHVAFVSDYDASTGKIYKMEGNYKQNGTSVYHEGWAPAWESDMYGYIYLNDSPAPTAQLSIDRKYYNPGDNVIFHFSGNNTNGKFTLGVYKEFDRYKTIDVDSNTYSIQFNDVASYSAYMTSYGIGGGYADSNWVDWQVLPLTAELRADKTKCNVNDKVTLSFHGNNSNTFAGEYVTLAVWCNGEYVVHKNVTGRNYEVTCDKPGEYKSYMTAYGGGELKDSNWVYWTVSPLTAELSADKTKCNVNDKVTLSFHGNNSNTFAGEYVTLAVLCNGEYIVHKNVTGSNYEVVCDKPGEYKSYMTAYGGGTYKDSNWVKWTVYPSTAATSISKPDLPLVKISKLKAAKKAATIKWKKVSAKKQKKIAKIQIQYSTDKNFKKNVKTVYAKKSATSKKITKLKSKKTYYVRIRAYKKSGGVVYVSKWSAKKLVRVK